MSGGSTGRVLGFEIDEDIYDIIVMFIVRDEDHFDLAGAVVAAVVDADANGGVAFWTDLGQQGADGFDVECFCVAELGRVFRADTMFVKAVNIGAEIGRILNSDADGKDVIFDAVLVDPGLAAAGMAAGKAENEDQDEQEEGWQCPISGFKNFVHKNCVFSR